MGIDAKHRDAIASSIGDQTEFAGWIDGEVAWCIEGISCIFNQGQCPLKFVDFISRNAIVSPIGSVQIFAIRMDLDMGRLVASLISLGQCG